MHMSHPPVDSGPPKPSSSTAPGCRLLHPTSCILPLTGSKHSLPLLSCQLLCVPRTAASVWCSWLLLRPCCTPAAPLLHAPPRCSHAKKLSGSQGREELSKILGNSIHSYWDLQVRCHQGACGWERGGDAAHMMLHT